MSFEHSLVVHFAPFQLMLLCIFGPIVLAVVGLILMRKVTPHESLKQYHDIAGPFLNTIGAIYGIFLALVVATTWQFYSTTGTNVVDEARCLQSLYLDSEAFTAEYRDSLVNREWKSIQQGESDPKTTELLHGIATAYAHYKVRDPSEEAYFHESVKNINSLQALRSSRIEDSGSGLIPFLWV